MRYEGRGGGAYRWQKSLVTTTSRGPGFGWVCVWGAAVPCSRPSHTVFIAVNSSWGKAAALRGCMERPVPLGALFSGDLQGRSSPIRPLPLVDQADSSTGARAPRMAA